MERLHDNCGVVGIYSRDREGDFRVERNLISALLALQHRGLESAGISVYDNDGCIVSHIGMGKVQDVFAGNHERLPATKCGIGHVRYSTTGSSCIENAGPFVVGAELDPYTSLALAHNGNLVNGAVLRTQLPQEHLRSTTDSETIALMLYYACGRTLQERIAAILPALYGAYSLTILAEGKLHAFRDPWGIRPLCIGHIGENWIVASESCAIEQIGATFIRQIEPGELVTIDQYGVHSTILAQAEQQKLCVFEYIYFADATSRLDLKSVSAIRQALGRALAREHARVADIVIPVPDTSIPAALGYAAATGIPYEQAIIKNPSSDRTFIRPDQRRRQLAIEQKFSLVRSKIDGARLVIVDDSIVRGNTMKHLVSKLRNDGAREIHLLSSSPPLLHSCQFGIDIPDETELIASGRSIQRIADALGVDSLGYLSLESLSSALNSAEEPQKTGTSFLDRSCCYGCMALRGRPFPLQRALAEPILLS